MVLDYKKVYLGVYKFLRNQRVREFSVFSRVISTHLIFIRKIPSVPLFPFEGQDATSEIIKSAGNVTLSHIIVSIAVS